MSLVKSMKKNRKQIMVFLLIFIMVGFVLGSTLPALINQITNWLSDSKPLAVYNNTELSRSDLLEAQDELKILRELMVFEFLNMPVDQQGNPNIKNALLSQVLFPDPQMGAFLSSILKRSATSRQPNSLQASPEQIDKFFNQTEGRNDILWLLLKTEAKNAGIAVPDSSTKQLLSQMIPAFTRQTRDAAVVVNTISRNYRKSPEEIIRIFSDFLAVTTYASTILTNENVTIPQIKSLIGLGGEKITSELVRFQVSPFEPNLPEPTPQQIETQFEKYKKFVPGVFTKENPYGFGYKQPANIVVEYMIIDLDDVRKIIEKPTTRQMDNYYQNNIQQYTSQVPVDPNAPEGEKKTVIQDFSEVEAQIRRDLIQQKILAKADQIMVNAVQELEKELPITDDKQEVDAEFYKKYAGSYEEIAKIVEEKHNISVYTGKTGKLSASKLAKDPKLGMLIVPSTRGTAGVGLNKVLFAVDELKETELGKFGPEKPYMWQNVGPLKSEYAKIAALVRVVQAQKPFIPETPDLSYDVKGVVLDDTILSSEEVYNLKEDIFEDVKEITKLEIAKKQAQKFVKLLEEEDNNWKKAVQKFNETIDPNTVSVQKISISTQKGKTRSSIRDEEIMKIRTAGMDSFRTEYINRMIAVEKDLQNKLYDLIPEDKKQAEDVKKIIESSPEKAVYVVKSVSVERVTTDDYTEAKAITAFQVDMTAGDALALIHYAPDNIIKRMGFEWAIQEDTENQQDTGTEKTEEKNNEDGEA